MRNLQYSSCFPRYQVVMITRLFYPFIFTIKLNGQEQNLEFNYILIISTDKFLRLIELQKGRKNGAN